MQSRQTDSGWTETALDYDSLGFTLSNLSCGAVYSFSLAAHNIAGRSRPSATLSSATLGGRPGPVRLPALATTNTTTITLHLHRWPNGGCPVTYYEVGSISWILKLKLICVSG